MSYLLNILFLLFTFQVSAVDYDNFPPLGADPSEGLLLIDDLDEKELIEPRSDLDKALELQSSVKSQGQRGTCSIFSAVALIESKLINEGLFFSEDIDLSEEWVQYIAMKGRESDGYWSFRSWNNISKHGVPLESEWPYDPRDWTKLTDNELVQHRCANSGVENKTSCLLGHRNEMLVDAPFEYLIDENNSLFDPEFLRIKTEAQEFKDSFISDLFDATVSWSSAYSVYSISEVRENLRNGEMMTLSVPFFYGAWNHGQATKLNIGVNEESWKKGLVGYPEKGSVDHHVSRQKENRAGHSILIVGYDDDIEIVTKQKMTDGTIKEFKYKGAYIFKNSWGTASFGSESNVLPGYGIITKKYAHEYGRFYQLK